MKAMHRLRSGVAEAAEDISSRATQRQEEDGPSLGGFVFGLLSKTSAF